MDKIKDYIKQNEQRFLDELFGLIRIPSISSESAHKPDMIKAAEYWRDSILKAGADKAEVMPTEGNPIVYGEKIIDPKKPTVLVYGHYDVMPVDPIELWNTDPFEPVIKDGKIWARGADDDKGQAFMHAKSLYSSIHFERLPEPISSSPSSINFTLQGRVPVCIIVSKALACMKAWPLSSSAPRAQILPSLMTGSNGSVFHNSIGSTGITS